MYSYQHRYHAGSFADIHKHLILIGILKHLQQKAAPFCVIDAFAGEGVYDLKSQESQKNQEYKEGFEKILSEPNLSFLLTVLVEMMHSYKNKEEDFIYPGSPAIICRALREQDRAICIENHPQAFAALKGFFEGFSNMHLHKREAFEAMNALIPFKEKRGLIFIDPSYEVKEEYHEMSKLIEKLYSKFSNGIYAIWYPILKENYHQKMISALKKINPEKVAIFEWCPLERQHADGIRGSGVLVINPPFQLEKTLQVDLEALQKILF